MQKIKGERKVPKQHNSKLAQEGKLPQVKVKRAGPTITNASQHRRR